MDDFTRDNSFPSDPEPNWNSAHREEVKHLLIALFPDRSVQSGIERQRKDWLWPRGSHRPPGPRLHLTLHCFEDQNHAVEMRLRNALEEVSMQPLDLVLSSSCTWRNDVSVIQPTEHEGLRALRRDIVFAVQRAGIKVRAPKFTPHVTIARHAEGAARPPHPAPIRWTAQSFALVRSYMAPWVRHEVLGIYRAR